MTFFHNFNFSPALWCPHGRCDIDIYASCKYFGLIFCSSLPSDRTYSHLLSSSYSCLQIDQSGYYLVSTSRDSSIKIWDLREGRLLFTLQANIFIIFHVIVNRTKSRVSTFNMHSLSSINNMPYTLLYLYEDRPFTSMVELSETNITSEQ